MRTTYLQPKPKAIKLPWAWPTHFYSLNNANNR